MNTRKGKPGKDKTKVTYFSNNDQFHNVFHFMWSACFSKIDLSYIVCHFIWFKPARKNAAVKKSFIDNKCRKIYGRNEG